MQLHTRMLVLVCQHACVNVLSVMCDGVLVSLIYCACVLHEGLHRGTCYSSGYKLASCMYVSTHVYDCTCNTSTLILQNFNNVCTLMNKV